MFIRQCYGNVMIVMKVLHNEEDVHTHTLVHNPSSVSHGSHSGFVYFMPTVLSALSYYTVLVHTRAEKTVLRPLKLHRVSTVAPHYSLLLLQFASKSNLSVSHNSSPPINASSSLL